MDGTNLELQAGYEQAGDAAAAAAAAEATRNLLLSLLFTAELKRAMVAQDARKVMKRKNAFLDTARSSRGVLDEEKMRRRLGNAIQGGGSEGEQRSPVTCSWME
jgi:hypothetical protein